MTGFPKIKMVGKGVFTPPTAEGIDQQRIAALEEVAGWAQAVLTALSVGSIQQESPLHKKLREVMIAYREKMESLGS